MSTVMHADTDCGKHVFVQGILSAIRANKFLPLSLLALLLNNFSSMIKSISLYNPSAQIQTYI